MSWEFQRERGALIALRAFKWIATTLGRGVARIFLHPIAAYFLITSATTRRASREFLARVLDRPATLRDVYRHVYTFASVSLDRVYLLTRSSSFDVRIDCPTEVATIARQRGCMLFVAHFGSFEVMRTGAVFEQDLPLRVVLDLEVGRRFMTILQELAPEIAAGIVDSSRRGPALALTLREALDAGQLVGMMVDRARADERTIAVRFLGRTAYLPAAPWLMAAALRVPVILAFGAYRGGRRYDVRFELYAAPLEIPRPERDSALRAHVQAYADRLAERARDAPYNWANFYDFWTVPTAHD